MKKPITISKIRKTTKPDSHKKEGGQPKQTK